MAVGLKKTNPRHQRRPFLTPVWLTAVAAALLVGLATWLWVAADSTTVILVRHAEKDPAVASDPPLSAEGLARAALLARMFGDAEPPGRLAAIYVSPALRNRMTAAPLAQRLGLKPIVVAAEDPIALANRALHEHEGARILIVGHADTIPKMVTALSGEKDVPAMGEHEYDTMYIVTVPRLGHANLLRLRY